ncbi:MAG: TspO/MBR family protein [archaeon]
MRFRKSITITFFMLICLLAGFIGSIFTTPAIPTWYAPINKPSFNPPNWIFAPVWTVLFLIMGVSLFLVWEKGWKNKRVKAAIFVFSIQLILNVLWSIVFFGLKNPFLAFIDIIALWIFILMSMIFFYRVSKQASLLLIPYILWVSFASALNLAIVLLN